MIDAARITRDLEEVREEFDKDNAWGRAYAVLVASGILHRLGVPDRLTEPLNSAFPILQDLTLSAGYKGNGPKPKSWNEYTALGLASALVTGFVVCGWRVSDAIKKVSKEAKIDASRLKSVRNNIGRGLAHGITIAAYHDGLEGFEDLTDREFEQRMHEYLRGFATWVRPLGLG